MPLIHPARVVHADPGCNGTPPERPPDGEDYSWAFVIDEWVRTEKVLDNPVKPIMSARAIMALELGDEKWALPGIVPTGLNVLAGKPKTCKSWLAMLFAIAVASGVSALSAVPLSPGEVLFLALEDGPRRLQKRLAKLLASLDMAEAPVGLTFATTWDKLSEGADTKLREWLAEHPSTRLVVIDTLARLRPSRAGSGSAYLDDYSHLTELKTVADECDIAMLLLHHLRKMSSADPFDTVSGTLGLTGAADGIVILRRERGRHDACLSVTGRDIEERELAIRWDSTTALWTLLGDARQYRVSQERQAVLDLLAQSSEPVELSEIAEALGKDKAAVKMLLSRMAGEGQVVRPERGRYELPPQLPAEGVDGQAK
jgi:hypothetical protein